MRLKGVVFSKLLIFEVFRFFWIFTEFYFNYFLTKITKKGVFIFHRPRGADMAQTPMWRAEPERMQRGSQGHVAEPREPTRSSGGAMRRGCVAWAARVHSDARVAPRGRGDGM